MNRKQRDNLLRKRLQHQLELQSMQIERVFSKHQVDVQVSGGRVEADSVRFDLQAQLSHGLERLRGLTQELRGVLGVPRVAFGGGAGGLSVQLPRPDDLPVPLLALLEQVPDELPAVTAVLGVSEANQPVLMQFEGQDAGHVLIAGVPGAGKTTLLRSIALSLALTNRQSRAQLVVMHPEAATDDGAAKLAPLDYLPHMLATVTRDVAEARDALVFLAGEVAYRREQQVRAPVVVVFVDGATTLLESAGDAYRQALTKVLQDGAAVGIYLVLSTARPQAAIWGQLLQAYVPLRVVGQMPDAAAAQAAAGVPGTQAEYLLGKGDFLAIQDQSWMRFQAAAVADTDLHLSLQMLHRSRPQPLLAQPLTSRLKLDKKPHGDAETAQRPVVFSYDGQAISMLDDRPDDVEQVDEASDDDWIELEA